jgi:hypothetical protein
MAQVGQVHMRRQALVAKPTHGHKERKMLSLLMWLAGTKEHHIFSTLFFTPIVNINRILYFSRNIF